MHLWNPPARIRRIRAPGAQVWLVADLVAMLAPAAATAQTRPALVRSVDEPARVPYAHFLAPTCPFGNVCIAEFPVVPAGKRLRLTQVSVVSIGVSSATEIFFVIHTFRLPPNRFLGQSFQSSISGHSLSTQIDWVYTDIYQMEGGDRYGIHRQAF